MDNGNTSLFNIGILAENMPAFINKTLLCSQNAHLNWNYYQMTDNWLTNFTFHLVLWVSLETVSNNTRNKKDNDCFCVSGF